MDTENKGVLKFQEIHDAFHAVGMTGVSERVRELIS